MGNDNKKIIFNNFNLTDKEILKIIEDFEPLILSKSVISSKVDEDLCQEIKTTIFKELSKHRKKK